MHPSTLLALLLTAPAPVDFDTEVLPVLTRAGCNAGSCHGAAAGRGGLHLSLWGSDPAADHDVLVRELEGRRVNLARPEDSLLLLKPTNQRRHGGGRRLAPDGDGARLLVDWVKGGAGRTPGRKLVRLVVSPSAKAFDRVGESVTFRVVAHYDDRSSADVTRWAVFSAADPASVDLDPRGKASALRGGRHAVVVRFLDRVDAVILTVPVGEHPADLRGSPRQNFIDEEVLATLTELRLPAAPPCDDATFVRRVSLDLTGTLPTPDEVRGFLGDPAPDKRARLVDRLLASSAFADYWALKWGNWLQTSSRTLGAPGARAFHGWVRGQLAAGRPLDEMAREMVTALGDTRTVAAANFSRLTGDARSQAEHLSRVFLGVRMQCANCHDHPLDRWTQDDYHGLAAVFSRLERGPVIRLGRGGEVIHPRTGEPARSRLPGRRFLDEGDRRGELADWLTGDNPFFARAAVNRMWKELMGRGLVEPVDDLRATNPASHPRLLDRLADDFTRSGHDLRHTLRRIALSAAYQRGSPDPAHPADDRFYSRPLVRPLGPEVLADAIVAVTGVPDRHGDLPLGTRAITLPDPLIPSPALDVLGRCNRAEPCDSEAAARGGLARTLHLINGELLNRKITDPKGRLGQLASRGDGLQTVRAFYLLALSREPTRSERTFWEEKLGRVRGDGRRELLEDFLWGLLTSREFTSNH